MNSEEYTTKNLNLAAYLYASGIRFVGASKLNGQLIFRFSPKQKAQELVDLFFSGTATINPRELFSRLHDLKGLIFDQGRERDEDR